MNRATVSCPARMRSPIEPAEEEPALSPQATAAAVPRLSFTACALLGLESVLWLMQPLVLGWAINGLLRRSYAGLLVFAVGHLLHLLVSSARRMHATQALAAIDRDPVLVLIRGVCSLAGALLLLGVYDWLLVPFCLLLLVPALLLDAAETSARRESPGCFAIRSNEGARLASKPRADDVEVHDRSAMQTRLSEAEAIRFGLMQLFVLAVLVGALVHFCAGAEGPPPAGDIFAVSCYLLMFIAGLDALPRISRPISSPRPTRLRLRTHPSDRDSPDP